MIVLVIAIDAIVALGVALVALAMLAASLVGIFF